MKKKITIIITSVCIFMILLLIILLVLVPNITKTYNIEIKNNNVYGKGFELNNKSIILTNNKYHITGSGDYTFIINSDKEIILDNLDINSDNTIFDIQNGDVTFNIKGNNTLSSKKNIISGQSIKMIGKGSLNIKESDNAINVNKDINIKDITLNINTIGNAIKSKNGNINIDNVRLTLKTSMEYIQDNEGRYIKINDIYYKKPKDYEYKETRYSLKDSSKGLKAQNIIINNSSINIDAIDDSISAEDTIILNKSELLLATNDDAISSDGKINVNNSKITINSCFEGLEAMNVEVNNTEIYIDSNDDGININGVGKDLCDTCSLNIKDSKMNINSSGDGIDAACNMTMENVIYNNKTKDDGIELLGKFDAKNSKIRVEVRNNEKLNYPVSASQMTTFDDNTTVVIGVDNEFPIYSFLYGKMDYYRLENIDQINIKSDNEIIIEDKFDNKFNYVYYYNDILKGKDNYYLSNSEYKKLELVVFTDKIN